MSFQFDSPIQGYEYMQLHEYLMPKYVYGELGETARGVCEVIQDNFQDTKRGGRRIIVREWNRKQFSFPKILLIRLSLALSHPPWACISELIVVLVSVTPPGAQIQNNSATQLLLLYPRLYLVCSRSFHLRTSLSESLCSLYCPP